MTDEVKNKKKQNLQEFNQKYGDPWIWGIFLMLIIISIVENYSASSREVEKNGVYLPIIKHCAFLLIGAAGALFVSRCKYNKPLFLAITIPVFAMVTTGLLTYVLFFGKVINGAQRAITLPGFTLQPSELAKVSIVTLLAYILAKHQKDKGLTNRGLAYALIAVGVYCGLMIKSGLTTCLLIMVICITMLVIGGANIKKVFLAGIAAAVVGGGAYLVLSKGDKNDELLREAEKQTEQLAVANADTLFSVSNTPAQEKADPAKVDRWGMRMERIRKWWDNDSLVYWAITGENTQEMFSRMAQAHGGIFGVGIGQSRECSRLPLAFSDYIYSIIVEETGLVGGIFVLLLYLSLLGRATIIVRKCNRALPSLLIIGMASLITYQALFHMAINTGVFPVSGQPLPLISNGGTAIMAISAAFGFMLSVSRTIAIDKAKAIKEKEIEAELPEGLDAENPIQIPTKNIWK